MAQKNFKTYHGLLQALERQKVRNPGITATTLLECFLTLSGELKASFVEGKGLCELGKFKIWRDEMIAKGWLCYTLGEYSKHKPGAKLLKYINKEKMITDEIATTRELYKVEKKLEETKSTLEEKNKSLESRVSLLERTVENLVKTYDPPVTDEKIKIQLKLAEQEMQ